MTKERKEYLKELALEYDVNFSDVLFLASLLGETEDYDGLVTSVQDLSEGYL